jgi:phosphatidylglycerophosphate synthase
MSPGTPSDARAPRARLATDEPTDRWVARPLARGLVRLLVHLPITANQVTFVAGATGVLAGIALGLGHGLVFAGLIFVFLVLDCADGELARRRGGGGLAGRVIDGVGDYAMALSIHTGLIAAVARGHGLGWGMAAGVAAGLSMAWHSFLLDRYKRRYRGEGDDLAGLEAEARASRGWLRWAMALFLPYARRLAATRPPGDLERYRERARAALRLWLLAGPTSHLTVFALLVAVDRPLEYAIMAVGPFHALVAVAFLLQRRAENP